MVLGTVIGLITLYLALRGVSLAQSWEILRETRLIPLGLGLAMIGISPFLQAQRWRSIFSDSAPSLLHFFGAVTTGRVMNFAIPFWAGEAARVLILPDARTRVINSVLIERTLDALFLLTTALAAIFSFGASPLAESGRTGLIVMTLLPLLILVLYLATRRWPGLQDYFRIPRISRVPWLLTLSGAVWAANLFTIHILLLALGIEASLEMSLLLMLLFQTGVAVPSSPGKVGVFQYLAILGLSWFGVEKAAALAFGILWHLLNFFPFLLMASGYWLLKRKHDGK